MLADRLVENRIEQLSDIQVAAAIESTLINPYDLHGDHFGLLSMGFNVFPWTPRPLLPPVIHGVGAKSY
jgi:hypothetical protein